MEICLRSSRVKGFKVEGIWVKQIFSAPSMCGHHSDKMQKVEVESLFLKQVSIAVADGPHDALCCRNLNFFIRLSCHSRNVRVMLNVTMNGQMRTPSKLSGDCMAGVRKGSASTAAVQGWIHSGKRRKATVGRSRP